MCGFVALISPANPIQSDLLSAMRDRLIHRGPDNGSNWVHEGGRIGFGHRRLSIIDKSHSADQPMISADESMIIVFNGEIYNYIELKDELKSLGCIFKTNSDTEVLLIALQFWGESALSRLNGMFSFVLWDERSKRFLVARDRFGEKPLFIGRGAFSTVIFASEMKAILAHPLMNCLLNEKSLERFANGTWYEDDEATFFEDISRFPPSHAAWYSEDGIEQRRWRYWTPDYTKINKDITPREAVEGFKGLMQRSISMRLRADVPIGSSLSGGLDSSVIVGYLSRERSASNFRQNTFSAIFPNDPTMSEDREIEAVTSYTGVNSFLVSPDPLKLAEESLLLHWHQEEPFLSASIYLQWCVARLARQNNTTVLLDGQGADELLAGYQFYFKQRQLDLLDQGRFEYSLRETSKFNSRLKIASNRYIGSHRRFNSSIAYTEDELRAMKGVRPPVFHYPYEHGVAPAKPKNRLRRTLSEALLYNSLPMLLRYADRNSMAFSRESRLPYLDYDLVDFCIALPDDYQIRNGWQKWVLREAAGNTIPSSIKWRADKVGYAAPLDIWLRNELFEWGYSRITDPNLKKIAGYDFDTICTLWDQHQTGQANNSWALWRWISLSEWLTIYHSGWWRSGVMAQPSTTGL
jgi:asparagine synthase (glutamine-hydrolysing)